MSKGYERRLAWLLAPAAWLGLSGSALACQPVIPMMLVTAPPTVMAMMLVDRHAWLTLAALAVAVLFKSGAFAWIERREIEPGLAFWLMMAGNLISTLVGIFTTTILFSGPGFGLLVFLLFGLPISLAPAKRLELFLSGRLGQRVSRHLLVLLLFFLLFAATCFFGLAQGRLGGHSELVAGPDYLGYWLWKLAYVLTGVGISMFLSALWEEWVIHRAYQAWVRGPRPDFVVSSLRANLYTMLIVGTMGAVMTLPERLRSPGFLISLLERLVAALA